MDMFDSDMLEYNDPRMNLDTGSEANMPTNFDPSTTPSDMNGNSAVRSDGATSNSIAKAEPQFKNPGADDNTIGGGPLPMPMPPGGFGQANPSAGSALTEFTKRRNWPAKVVEELKDLLQILDANGRIKYTSPSILNITGYKSEDIQDVFLKELVHPDDKGVFVAELNESIASGNPLRLFYRIKKKDGNYTIFETVGHAHIAASKFAPNPNNQSPFCQAVFMMASPYPTKNAGLLDSFLEHKIENERLQRRIAEMRREEDADNDETQRQWTESQEGRSDAMASETTQTSATVVQRRNSVQDSMRLSHSDRNALNVALTRENLEGASAGSRPDSLRDKMARFEGTSHADTIEMLTGLRYMEGERSKGITTGNASPTLIKGDAGIAIPVDRDPRTGEKKKKSKPSEEYVCTDCGTSGSRPAHTPLADPYRHSRLSRMAQRPQRAQDTLQRLRSPLGQEGEEEGRAADADGGPCHDLGSDDSNRRRGGRAMMGEKRRTEGSLVHDDDGAVTCYDWGRGDDTGGQPIYFPWVTLACVY